MSAHPEHPSHSKSYLLVWMALLILTAITVWVSYYNFGEWNIFVAMLVASIKATLVCLFFMHLKYDNRFNQVVFSSAFVFLVIFIGLTLSDELVRKTERPAKVIPIPEAQTGSLAKMNELRQSTPELITQGKTLYQANCVSCHGPNGQGDGPAASALNPRPRNFTLVEGWKNGRAPAQIFKTLKEGLPGSSMPAFDTLALEDRWALTHYVHSLSPNAPADTPATLAAIGIVEGSKASASKGDGGLEIPVSFAIEKLVREVGKK